MEWISDNNVLIVGLGLMGGSYAKALKRLGYKVYAIDRNEESISYAINENIIDDGRSFPDPELISKADAVIFALYPEAFREWIRENQQYFHEGVMITDVTGVKSSIVYDIQDMLREDVEFIPSHPMAGRELSGVKSADDKIFRNANYIVTPTKKNTKEAIEWCKSLGRILGVGKISVLSPEEHDEMIGFVSQLTHCIAVSLMTCSDDENLADYTGDSFRDLTRIARINENMWSELFLMNKDKLIEKMDVFINEFSQLKDMIKNDDRAGLCEKMKLSTKRRAWFDK